MSLGLNWCFSEQNVKTVQPILWHCMLDLDMSSLCGSCVKITQNKALMLSNHLSSLNIEL